MMPSKLAVFGSLNQDLVVHAERSPDVGETVFGERFAMHPGGKGANQAVALAQLGLEVAMFGCVGDDSFGRELRMSLQQSGVRVDGVTRVHAASGVALVQVEGSGDNRITVVPGANAMFTAEMVQDHWPGREAYAMVLTQLETPMAGVAALGRMCQRDAVPLMLDPAPARQLSRNLLQSCAWLTPNLGEAQTLLATESAPATPGEAMGMAERLLELGSEGVLLKLGAMGAAVAQRGKDSCFQPAFPVQVVDTTAAGDACNAAFAAALVLGETTDSALRFAAAAAAISVSRHGAQPAMPTQQEVRSFLQSAST